VVHAGVVDVGLSTLIGELDHTHELEVSQETNRWVNLGVLFNFLKQYRRTIVQHVTANASDKLSSDQWWVIAYAIAPAIEEINKTFVMS
jgi:hypothetical protein